MKLVELLAREWSEWPGNCDYAVCDSDGEIRAIGTGTNNDFYPADAVDLEDRLNGTALLVSDDGKRVIRTDWAAERARIAKPAKKADKDGWIRHRGGKCPVKIGTPVDVRYRDGNIHMDVPAQTIECRADNWLHTDDKNSFDAGCDIMAYRLHKPAEQVEPVREPVISFEDMNPGMTVRFMRYTGCGHRHWGFVPGKMYSVGGDKYSAGPVSDKGEIPSANWGFEFALVSSASEPAEQPQRSEIVSQLQQECVGLVESANSLNQYGPLQWRDRITEIDATTHALTTERADLVQKLASEGFALIGRINDLLTDAAQKHEAQQPDPGKWEVGDSIECISSNYSFITVGTVYVITGFDRNMVQFLDDDGTEMEYGRQHFKCHSRPSA